MHESIITRLDATLGSAHRQLVTKILTWIVCALRPLRLVELQEVLSFEIREGRTAGQPPVDDDDLLYSVKDIELACGALVLSRNGSLRLICLSKKEILMKRPSQMLSNDSRLAFYVDAPWENPHMTLLCISSLSTHLDGIKPLTRPNLGTVSKLQISKDSHDLTDFFKRSPFIHYASISWQAHLIDGKTSLEFENVMCRLQTLLTYDLTIFCRAAGRIQEVAIAGLEDLVTDVVWAAFHPRLPLLVLTSITCRESDVEDIAKAGKVIEIDLQALRSVQINLPKHDLFISKE